MRYLGTYFQMYLPPAKVPTEDGGLGTSIFCGAVNTIMVGFNVADALCRQMAPKGSHAVKPQAPLQPGTTSTYLNFKWRCEAVDRSNELETDVDNDQRDNQSIGCVPDYAAAGSEPVGGRALRQMTEWLRT